MDRNNVIGMTLIFALFLIWFQINSKSPAQLAEEQRIQDSLKMEQVKLDDQKIVNSSNSTAQPEQATIPDSMKQVLMQGKFGDFAANANGSEKLQTLENDLIKITFTNKGGKVKEATLSNYFKIKIDSLHNETKSPLKLMEDDKNIFEYYIPVANAHGGKINTNDLYFTPSLKGNTISFKADAGNGRYIEQTYTLADNSYNLDYDLKLVGLDQPDKGIELNWVQYLDKLENNTSYERNYSSIYYKEAEDSPTYCSCTSDDKEDLPNGVEWVSHSNQFFNTALIPEKPFKSAELTTSMLDENNEDLKIIGSKLMLPLQGNETYAMQLYLGPNEFERLAAYHTDLEDIIPYGRSVFGTINRWIIRPLFNFLSGFISSKGLVILLLTFLVKLVLYPLTYKMLHSQSKMGALKPRLAKMKEKFGDDQQAQQMETMKMYREFGVNPLGGCFPIALQMPIWFALYRFFPASIEFRQSSFLWATDLSSYDVFAYLPFEIPFYGSHVSLFTLLWAGSTLVYTYYNSKHMDMTANPMMKYMQYFMPLMFLFFFNNFAAGLTVYLVFSNLMNIGQTIITKNYIIDQEKIKKELEAYKKKPKKKGGFQSRLEQALKEQQKMQDNKSGKSNKKKK